MARKSKTKTAGIVNLVKPPVDEYRGRRFIKAMEDRYAWRRLTGLQITQVLNMAEEIHSFMRGARETRTRTP